MIKKLSTFRKIKGYTYTIWIKKSRARESFSRFELHIHFQSHVMYCKALRTQPRPRVFSFFDGLFLKLLSSAGDKILTAGDLLIAIARSLALADVFEKNKNKTTSVYRLRQVPFLLRKRKKFLKKTSDRRLRTHRRRTSAPFEYRAICCQLFSFFFWSSVSYMSSILAQETS